MTKGEEASRISTDGLYRYSTSEDEYIAKAMGSEDGLSIQTEPSMGFPHAPLTSVHSCVNDMCKSTYSQVLTTCPQCGVDRTSTQLSKSGHRGVILDQGVARSLRPPKQETLRLPAGLIVGE